MTHDDQHSHERFMASMVCVRWAAMQSVDDGGGDDELVSRWVGDELKMSWAWKLQWTKS